MLDIVSRIGYKTNQTDTVIQSNSIDLRYPLFSTTAFVTRNFAEIESTTGMS